jgi:hypothetical protein
MKRHLILLIIAACTASPPAPTVPAIVDSIVAADVPAQVTAGKPPIVTKLIPANGTGVNTVFRIDGALTFSHALALDGFLEVGDALKEVRILVQDNSRTPTTLIASLREFLPGSGQAVTLAASQPSAASGFLQTLVIGGLDLPVIAGGPSHNVLTIMNTGPGPAAVWSVEIDYTRPVAP